ncbi:hypothetical protein EV193_102733 [Herbihabitans rhizosphaerae]|uniref:Peptidase M1 membrane alanine aminopeptidase domain-containing protein n=1 Tax=Herbihabitans rhizosphaerae TaxID=1872711 RepID=A0A4Q7L643_9PSEU|nr:hypothetical protein [Herbihabitans rhizosphaerae]RZS43752.1 hypothetical protein EV193_102733 [Herbihabitans rhizosphaerae]
MRSHTCCSIYDKGPLALHALRKAVGDESWNRLIKQWTQDNAGGNQGMTDFQNFVEKAFGQQLDELFTAWFDGTVIQ